MKHNTAILIGSTGFIGKSIVKNFNKKLIKFNSKNLNLLKKSSINKHAKKFKNSTIIYAAGIKRTRGDTFQNFNKNIFIFNNLFSFFFKNRPKKIIFLSSAEVYGKYKGKKKINEKTPINPFTLYSLSKIIQEKTIKFFSDKVGYEYIILRLPGIYGRDKEEQSIVSKIVAAIIKKKTFKLNTSGNELRDYIYVNDVGKIVFELSKKKIRNLTINLATGKSLKITEIIKIIQMKLKKNIQLQKTNFKDKIEYDLIYKNNLLKSLLPNFRFKYLKDFDFKKEFST